MQEAEPRSMGSALDTDDDPGGSADREDAPGRDLEHIEEQSPDDFDEADEVSHG